MKLLFPGSFDPPTLGHEDIIKKASELCNRSGEKGELYCTIFNNPSKLGMYSIEKRRKMLLRLADKYANMSVDLYSGLLCDYFVEGSFDASIRGLRNCADFQYEFEMAEANKTLNEKVITIFLPASPEFSWVSSSLVRKMISLGQKDFAPVPPEIKDLL